MPRNKVQVIYAFFLLKNYKKIKFKFNSILMMNFVHLYKNLKEGKKYK